MWCRIKSLPNQMTLTTKELMGTVQATNKSHDQEMGSRFAIKKGFMGMKCYTVKNLMRRDKKCKQNIASCRNKTKKWVDRYEDQEHFRMHVDIFFGWTQREGMPKKSTVRIVRLWRRTISVLSWGQLGTRTTCIWTSPSMSGLGTL